MHTTAGAGGACSSGAWSKRLESTCFDIFFTPKPPVLPAGLRPDISLGFGAVLGALGFVPAPSTTCRGLLIVDSATGCKCELDCWLKQRYSSHSYALPGNHHLNHVTHHIHLQQGNND